MLLVGMSVNSTRKRSRNQKTKRENCNKHDQAAPIGIHKFRLFQRQIRQNVTMNGLT